MLGALFTDGFWFDGLSVNGQDLGSANITTDSQGRIVKVTGGVMALLLLPINNHLKRA